MTKTFFVDHKAGQNYPEEMRTQLWPLCCGARIISGFKNVQKLTDDELVKQINDTIDNAIPDLQVYGYETIQPALTFLTLNSGQMVSKKIMDAIARCGFVKFAEGNPRGAPQGFFVQDKSGTFTVQPLPEPVKKGAKKETAAA
ncbi:MAG: hypothetical protein B7Z80_02710 [Rhodospirillales bacterium 20-64-7]|nr:MAG: hypothetical protein B7Z80_02710 [Rhodospirillales bacterium 20-64-7]